MICMTRIKAKRTRPLEKAWYILKPFILYMVVKTVVMLFLSLLAVSLPQASLTAWVSAHSNQVNAVINALASIVGAAFLLNDFLKEVAVTGEIDIDSSVFAQLVCWIKQGMADSRGKAFLLAVSASLGITSSLAFNILAELVQLKSKSAGYEKVETIQYSVPIWLGVLLYGVVSPFVEEVVFRGLTYNRMKRFFRVPLCTVATALLFAAFHGNLAQFVYALCMGLLLALCYEWTGCFGAPLLFHAAANLFVFILSGILTEDSALISAPVLVFFALLSAALMLLLYRSSRKFFNFPLYK